MDLGFLSHNIEQPDAAQQILEALVGAQRIQLGFYVQIAQPKRPLFKRFLQPGESFIVFS